MRPTEWEKLTVPASPPRDWCVYVLEDTRGRFYTGITNNMERRLKRHNAGRVTATRGRVWSVFAWIPGFTRREAAAYEHYLKSGDTLRKRVVFVIHAYAVSVDELNIPSLVAAFPSIFGTEG